MITMLRGRVHSVEGDHVILDVGGVGYEVACHLRSLAHLHSLAGRNGAAEVTLHVHTSVADDAIRLFGFPTREELRLFRLLLGVERIGPRAALGILGRAELPVMVKAIRGGDAALVATVPGIGRKTAERVVLELGDRLGALTLPGDAAPPAQSSETAAMAAAVAGLAGLGFRESEARSAVAAVIAEHDGEPEVNSLVGAALRRLDKAAAAS